MSAHVLLNLFNELMNIDKMLGLRHWPCRITPRRFYLYPCKKNHAAVLDAPEIRGNL